MISDMVSLGVIWESATSEDLHTITWFQLLKILGYTGNKFQKCIEIEFGGLSSFSSRFDEVLQVRHVKDGDSLFRS